MKHFILFLIYGIFLMNNAEAQNSKEREKPTIAVLPFNYDSSVKKADAGAVALKVESAFINSKRFTVIERANFQQIFDELEAQKDEAYLHSDQLAKQGKLIGASQIVTGTIKALGGEGTSFSIKVVDITTGEVIGSKDISDKGKKDWINSGIELLASTTKNKDVNDIKNSSTGNTVGSLLLNIDKEIKDFIKSYYPLTYDILEISKSKGTSATELLLIGGTSDGMEKNMKMDILKETVTKKDDQEFIRKTKIGEIQVETVEGEVAVCKVKKGGKEITEELGAGQNIYASTSTK